MNEAQATAQAIEETPASAYARAIATSRYGMNPALAAGTFGSDVDVEAYKQQREARSMQLTGMPYEEVRQREADFESDITRARTDEEYARKRLDQDMVSAIESATGLSATRMRALTGLSNAGMYEYINNREGGTIQDKVTAIGEDINKVVQMYNDPEANSDDREKILSDLYASVDDRVYGPLASMTLAVLLQQETMRGKTQSGLSAAALNQQMPLYDFDTTP
jgi:hypothetical protein